MKIVFLSDTHGYLPKVDVPSGDVLVHCGDALSTGRLSEFATFCRDLKFLAPRFRKVLYTPGNHDVFVQDNPGLARQMLDEIGVELLLHQKYEFKGVIFFGSPYTPRFGPWAFMYDKSAAEDIWARTPDEVDVFFCDGMPYGILDSIGYTLGIGEERVGCPVLLKRLRDIKPKIFAGGHLHLEGGKRVKIGETLFVNAAVCDMSYSPKNPIQIVTLEKRYGCTEHEVTKRAA